MELKIMANENMDEWQSSVAVIDETVRAVKRFLNAGIEKHIGSTEICNFLGWGINRVNNSLSRINAIESGAADKKAVETIPTAKAATAFTASAKAHKLDVKQQRKVAKRILESGNYSPKVSLQQVFEPYLYLEIISN
ncbi:MAG: hypothetical protein K8S16_16705 [Bacteroidales bacterium]|nr:hypothetical protein [Bacteroidales bacterium]